MKNLSLILSFLAVANAFGSSPEREPNLRGPRGPKGDKGDRGEMGPTGPGLQGSVFTIPNNAYLVLPTANGHVTLNVTCNYGSSGDNEVFFFANDSSVTAGSVLINMDLAGQVQSFSDLVWNGGGMDRGFPNTGYQGTWPWHGVFTVNERGTLTKWDIFVNGSSGHNCTATIYSFGNGSPYCGPSACL